MRKTFWVDELQNKVLLLLVRYMKQISPFCNTVLFSYNRNITAVLKKIECPESEKMLEFTFKLLIKLFCIGQKHMSWESCIGEDQYRWPRTCNLVKIWGYYHWLDIWNKYPHFVTQSLSAKIETASSFNETNNTGSYIGRKSHTVYYNVIHQLISYWSSYLTGPIPNHTNIQDHT